MSHSVCIVVVPEAENALDAEAQLDDLLDKFNENNEIEHIEELDEDEVIHCCNLFVQNPDLATQEDGPGLLSDVPQGDLEAWNEWRRRCVGAFNGDVDRGHYDPETQTFSYTSYYNPDSRWDWWVLGGRWHGYFQLKPGVPVGSEPVPEWRTALAKQFPIKERVEGAEVLPVVTEEHHAILGLAGVFGDDPSENFTGRADLARKDTIDFEGMRTLAAQEADAAYDKFEEATRGIEPAPRWIDHLKLAFFEANLDPEVNRAELSEDEEERYHEVAKQARTSFAQHPWMQALHQAELSPWFDDTHETWCVGTGGRQAYVRRAQLSAGVPVAILHEGVWHEQGRMGWFGQMSNEKDPDIWNHQASQLLDSLPDTAWLAAVDVHI